MRGRRIRFFLQLNLIILLSLLTSCFPGHSAKTPEGVDIGPLCSIAIPKRYDNLDKIYVSLGRQPEEPSKDGKYIARMSTHWNENNDEIYREIELYQCVDDAQALSYYNYCQKLFSTDSSCGKLYKEGVMNDWKYFMTYEKVHFNTNHGIPCGIIDTPRILLGFVNKNLVIIVSYDSYENQNNYIAQINEDVKTTASLLSKSLQ